MADRVARFVEGFTADMRAAGIHVGLAIGDAPGRCVVDGELWPCAVERAAREAGGPARAADTPRSGGPADPPDEGTR